MQLTYDTTPSANSLNVDIPGNCSAPATSQSSGRSAQNGPMLKAKPEYRGNPAV